MSLRVPWLLLIVLLAGPTLAVGQETRGGQHLSRPPVATANTPGSLVRLDRTTTQSGDSTSTHFSVSPTVGQTGAQSVTRPASTATDPERLQLLPPSRTRNPEMSPARGESSGRTLTTVCSSLAIVLGVFLLVVWVSRKAAPRGTTPLPGEVIESLGRAPLIGRQQAQLLRVGKKLVLISITPGGVEPITEITDPAEVDRLSALCQQDRTGSISDSFRNVLSQFANEPTPRGFIGRS